MSEADKKMMPPLPFLNTEFLQSPPARAIRILSEYLEPADRLRRAKVRDTIVFFGSARALTPAEAIERYEHVNEKIRLADAANPELEAAKLRAESALRMANYYESAVELARRITEWSKSLTGSHHFIVCSGGSSGIMEAANRGASQAAGKTIGFNISLPHEQQLNSYISNDLIFNFHYFFMRKFWFVYLAKALIVFPGGFGTMDEMFEVLTLIQTRKPRKSMPVVLFGTEFWNEVLDFDALARWGVISPEDAQIFYRTDQVDDAFDYLTTRLEEMYLVPEGLEAVKLT